MRTAGQPFQADGDVPVNSTDGCPANEFALD
jgi:hypothetical protein